MAAKGIDCVRPIQVCDVFIYLYFFHTIMTHSSFWNRLQPQRSIFRLVRQKGNSKVAVGVEKTTHQMTDVCYACASRIQVETMYKILKSQVTRSISISTCKLQIVIPIVDTSDPQCSNLSESLIGVVDTLKADLLNIVQQFHLFEDVEFVHTTTSKTCGCDPAQTSLWSS